MHINGFMHGSCASFYSALLLCGSGRLKRWPSRELDIEIPGVFSNHAHAPPGRMARDRVSLRAAHAQQPDRRAVTMFV